MALPVQRGVMRDLFQDQLFPPRYEVITFVNRICYTESGIRLSVEEAKGANRNFDFVLTGQVLERGNPVSRVKLLAAYEEHRRRIYIEDLTGNGYGTGLQAQGIGTLLFNTALLIFKREFPLDMLVYGELSDIGDPKEHGLALECRLRREKFWSSFGFELHPGPPSVGTTMSAQLGDLHTRCRGERIFDRFPRYVELSRFKHADQD